MSTNSTEETPSGLQQRNLVYNSDFLDFSKPSGNDRSTPAGWSFTGGKKSTIEPNSAGQGITIFTGFEQTELLQSIHEFPNWEQYLIGKTVSAVALVKVESNCYVTFTISDGVSHVSNTVNLKGEKQLKLHIDIDKNATELIISISCDTPDTSFEISTVYANVGETAIEGLHHSRGKIGEKQH